MVAVYNIFYTLLVWIEQGFIPVGFFILIGGTIFIILFMFFIPQYYIHLTLKKAKTELLAIYQQLLGYKEIAFLKSCLNRFTEKTADASKEQLAFKSETISDIEQLDRIIKETNSYRDWNFNPATLGSLLTTILLPLLIYIIEYLIRNLI